MEYQVKDITLADFGRKEIEIAEQEMPGLMATRAKYGPQQPLKGVKIMGSLHMTIQTAVLIETLKALGADVRWASCNIFSTQDHAAAAIAADGVPVFAWTGETLEEYWECTYRALTWPDGSGPDQIVDDGGDATLLIHRGVKAEDNPAILDEPTDVLELQIINNLLKKVLREDAQHWHKVAAKVKGVSEETTTGVHRLIQMQERGELLFPAINVNDSVTKSKFDNIYGCRHSLTDGIKRALDVMLSGKTVMVCGYGDVGKGCAEALHNERARVMVSEVDPICALQACMAGFQVCTVEDALPYADLYVTTTGNCRIITVEHMAKMKDQAIVCNIGHFDDEIEVAKLEAYPGIKKVEIKGSFCPVSRFTFPDGHSIYLLAEPRLRDGPSVFRDVEQLYEPDAGADRYRPPSGPQSRRLPDREEARRGSGAAASGKAGCEADETDAGTGGLHRCSGGRPLQKRQLPLLKTIGRGFRSNGAKSPLCRTA